MKKYVPGTNLMCAGLALLLSACGQPPGESGASKPPTSAPEPEFVTTDQPRTPIGVDVACGTTCVITIDGDITPELSNYLLAIATEPRITTSARRIVKISSDGGDVNHALVIGKLFRLMEATVEVPQGKHCFSSCVLILAGGVLRGPLGSIGIHRPYFSDGAASYAEAQNRYGSLKPQVVEFLELGGVNPALWEDMLRTPPEDIRILTQADLEHYGLFGLDPSYAEKVAQMQMRRLNISRQELNRRRSDGKELCSQQSESDYATCLNRYIEQGR